MAEVTAEPKITIIPPHPARTRMVVGRFRWLVWLYRRYMKPIPPLRATAIIMWRNLYPLYLAMVSRLSTDSEARKWRSLIRFSQYIEENSQSRVKLVDEAYVKTRAPVVNPREYQGYITHQVGYVAPEVDVGTFSSVTINGGTNLLQLGGQVVCHDLFDLAQDYTSEELHGRALFSVTSRRVRLLKNDKKPEALAVAASFVDACAPNYAHWLTEVLPRLAVYCSDPRFAGVPILINAGLHRNILDSISYFVGADREIIALSIGRAVEVKELHAVSVAGYVPFGRRKRRRRAPQTHSQGCFNPHALARIRAIILPIASSQSNAPTPQKFYIRRNSGGRRITNATELEMALVERGFSVIEPEKLNFLDQVRLFANAETIVGASGAALANIVFAASSAKIHVMIGRYPDTSFWYWQNIASAVGANIDYVFGEIQSDGGEAIHADFRIDVPSLLTALDDQG